MLLDLALAAAPLLAAAPSVAAQESDVVPAAEPSVATLLGPVLGDLGTDAVKVWLRSGDGADVEWTLFEGVDRRAHGRAGVSDGRDRTAVVALDRLSPDTNYRVALKSESGIEGELSFRTLGAHEEVETVRVAFGSCASHDRFEAQPIWTAIAQAEPRALVLLGDTPYIETTDLERQRTRYREFWSILELRPLAASVPVYSTWDDHDFATNDQVGAQPGRENSRRAFVEYHPQPSFGDGERGIYTSFRSGPVEVFLVDTRWFGDEERWTVDDEDERTSLLGRVQREALIAAVAASSAEVKILACGMVWNGAVRPGKRDCWGTWAHERDAIFRALRERSVKGLVLVGGDVHRPRVIRHVAAEEHLGYVPVEFVSSPLANHPIPAAAAPHPGLVWDAEADSVALIVDITRTDGAPLVEARMIGPGGEVLHAHTVSAEDLGHD